MYSLFSFARLLWRRFQKVGTCTNITLGNRMGLKPFNMQNPSLLFHPFLSSHRGGKKGSSEFSPFWKAAITYTHWTIKFNMQLHAWQWIWRDSAEMLFGFCQTTPLGSLKGKVRQSLCHVTSLVSLVQQWQQQWLAVSQMASTAMWLVNYFKSFCFI